MSEASVALLSVGEAQRLDQRLKLTIESIDNSLFKLRNLLDEAKTSNSWSVLGFPSWTAYFVSLFEGRTTQLPADQRREITGYLAEEGLSSRAIAPVVGVSDRMVRKDLASGGNQVPTSLEDDVVEAIEETEEPTAGEAGVPARHVTGMDGKQYGVPIQKKPNRRALPAVLHDVVNDLRRVIDRLDRVATDDRFPAHRAQFANDYERLLNSLDGSLAGFIESLVTK